MTLAVKEQKEPASPPSHTSPTWVNLLLAGTSTGVAHFPAVPAPVSATFIGSSYVGPTSITWIEDEACECPSTLPTALTAPTTITRTWIERPGERPLFLPTALTTSYHYTDPRETEKYRERAFAALRTLVQRFPQAKAALMWAIREGKIDGTTYLPWDYTQNPFTKKKDMAEHAEEARCIIGWVMVAMGTDYPYERALSVEHRGDLEAFVIDINPGETHQSNRWLGMLYHALEEMQV